MSFEKRDATSLPLYNQLKLFTFDTNLSYQLGNFLWKVQHNFLPNNIINTFSLRRQAFTVPTYRTDTRKHSLYYLGVKGWIDNIQRVIGRSSHNPANLLKNKLGVSQGFKKDWVFSKNFTVIFLGLRFASFVVLKSRYCSLIGQSLKTGSCL